VDWRGRQPGARVFARLFFLLYQLDLGRFLLGMKYTQYFYTVFFDLVDNKIITPYYVAVNLSFGRQETALWVYVWVGKNRINLLHEIRFHGGGELFGSI
jgi:hypothetical protein